MKNKSKKNFLIGIAQMALNCGEGVEFKWSELIEECDRDALELHYKEEFPLYFTDNEVSDGFTDEEWDKYEIQKKILYAKIYQEVISLLNSFKDE